MDLPDLENDDRNHTNNAYIIQSRMQYDQLYNSIVDSVSGTSVSVSVVPQEHLPLPPMLPTVLQSHSQVSTAVATEIPTPIATPTVSSTPTLPANPVAMINNNNNNNNTNTSITNPNPWVVYPIAERQMEPTIASVKYARKYEFNKIRQRWQKRKYNYHQEQDVGHAVAEQVHQHFKQQQEQQQQQQQQRTTRRNNRKRKAEISDMADDEHESSHSKDKYHIHDSILEEEKEEDDDDARILSQMMLPAQNEAKLKTEKEENNSLIGKSYKESMDYWERGESAPPRIETIRSSTIKPIQSDQTASRIDTNNESSNNNNVFQIYRMIQPERTIRKTRDFPLHNEMVPGSVHLVQRRQIFRAAARHIVGTSGHDPVTDARCIAALWKLSHRQMFAPFVPNNVSPVPWSAQEQISNHLARRQGEYWYLFVTHQWKDRAAAAHYLGLRKLAGCPYFVGKTIKIKTDDSDRRTFDRCLRLFGIPSAPRVDWAPFNRDNESTTTKFLTTRGLAMLEPQTQYVHLPGTVPPTPMGPLDVTGIILGPSDRFEHVHHLGPIDQQAFKLTVASLLNRLILAIKDDDTTLGKILQKQLRAVLCQMIKCSKNQSPIFSERTMHINKLEIPLHGYYQSLQTYCSIVANLGDGLNLDWVLQREDNAPEPNQQNDPIQKLAIITNHLFDFLEPHMNHKGLQMFPKLHITYGILYLAHTLPASSIAILAEPLDRDGICETPSDRMRTLLQHLEDAGLIVDVDYLFVKGRKNVAELEYTIHRVSLIMEHCTCREPTNPLYHAWYTSSLAAGLLLCSGQLIGGPAYPFPSNRTRTNVKQQREQSLFSSFKDNSDDDNHDETEAHLPHEVRQRLPKFQELRQQTAKALYNMALLARHQQGNQAHRMMASFLEWRQVLSLLIGDVPDHAFERIGLQYSQVCSLHRYHTKAWSLQENSESTFHTIHGQVGSSLANTLNDRLEAIACLLEINPNRIEHWRSFVHELGPIIRLMEDVATDRCQQATCTECTRVVRGDKSVCHSWIAQHRQSHEWWGRDRCEWWYDLLLQEPLASLIVLSGTTAISEEVKTKWEQIQKTMKEEMQQLDVFVVEAPRVDETIETDHDVAPLDWLVTILSKDTQEEESIRTIQERSQPVDQYLPETYQELRSKASPIFVEDSVFMLPRLNEDVGHRWEVLAYKTLIVCHLYGLTHVGVDRGICRLVQASCNDLGELQRSSSAFACLEWLYRMGIDVCAIFAQSQPKENTPNVKSRARTLPKKLLMRPTAAKDVVRRAGVITSVPIGSCEPNRRKKKDTA